MTGLSVELKKIKVFFYQSDAKTMVGSFFSKALESRPRFSLSASNGVITRFSGHDYIPWEEACLILHVNLSGVAIAVPEPLVPVLGEWVLLEVPTELSQETNSFYGKVVHLQDLSDNYKGVVIQFISTQLSEKFEISRAFSALQSDHKSELRPGLDKPDFVPLSKHKVLLTALVFFWLLALTLIFGSFFK
jgi:hypothetical protein